MQTLFKTIYFPGNRTRTGKSARVTISVPEQSTDTNVLHALNKLSGQEMHDALGNVMLEDLEELAQREGQSLSVLFLKRLSEALRPKRLRAQEKIPRQKLAVEITGQRNANTGFGVTFRESKRVPIHSWYPYVEGFSARYVHDTLLRFESVPSSVYDPFGGAGTTQLAAAMLDIPCFYAEVNPFMSFVADTKITSTAWAVSHFDEFEKIAGEFSRRLHEKDFRRRVRDVDLTEYESVFPERDFFEEHHLRELLVAKELANEVSSGNEHVRSILWLACAANVVRSSNMTRRADLRRRRADEYKNRVVDVTGFIDETLLQMTSDIKLLSNPLRQSTKISADAKKLPKKFSKSFDFAITSPPYLNGTNYFRNTKLELWYLGFLKSEAELAPFRQMAVCAGINNVSSSRKSAKSYEFVEAVADAVEQTATDRRIPMMIRHYFSDMAQVCAEVFRVLKPGGRFVLDIGDSCFYGVHVPTDELLQRVAITEGFVCESSNILAPRYSKTSLQLKQVELVFKKPFTT